jgi:multimeric flavodoxin WrbA
MKLPAASRPQEPPDRQLTFDCQKLNHYHMRHNPSGVWAEEANMNIVAIMGSYRKGRTIDTLVDRAIAGATAGQPETMVDKIVLIDRHIEYCRNCMTCRNDDPSKNIATCVIRDDMQAIYPLLDRADAFIFGTPINCSHETAIMKTFIERVCYVLAKPGKYPLQGCPAPRTTKKKKAIAIMSAGVVPPLLRMFCDDATSLIRTFCGSILNARLVGSMYAGAVEKRGVDIYAAKAYHLGQKLQNT